MKKLFALSSLILSVTASVLGVSAFSASKAKPVDAAVGNYTTNASTYYNNITATGGTKLLGQLHDLMMDTHRTYTSYDDNGKNLYQQYTDVDPNNSSRIIDFYSGYSMPNEWDPNVTGGYNREHLWCQSLSNGLWDGSTLKGGGADMHHIRPIEMTENSTRNNNPYGEVSNHSSSYLKYPKDKNKNVLTNYPAGYLVNGVWEPMDNKKGDVARIVLYVYTHYNTYSNVGGSKDNSSYSTYFGNLPITNIMATSTESAAWEMLVRWNNLDPVDNLETTRNNVAAKYQGNRNPFIDHPEYVSAIWGNGVIEQEPRLTMESTATVTVGATKDISATLVNGTGTISYVSSDTSVATVSSSGVVTGVKAGTSTVTASVVISGTTYSAKCVVTVTDSSSTVIGFEASEGFATSTTFNNTTVKYWGNSDSQWGTYYGSPTATASNVIVGSQSLQLRWYTSAVNNLGYTFMNYDIANISSVSFKAKATNGLNIALSYSTNGTTWTNKETFTLTTTVKTYTSSFASVKASRLKFTIVLPSTRPTATSIYTMDDVEITTSSQESNYNATSFASEFLSKITCSGTGSITSTSSAWTSMSEKYNTLSSTDKTTLKNANANQSGTNIEKCVARYDYIINKYGTSSYTNYIGRTISSAPALLKSNITNNNEIILVISVMLSVSSLGIYFVIRKRKEQ